MPNNARYRNIRLVWTRRCESTLDQRLSLYAFPQATHEGAGQTIRMHLRRRRKSRRMPKPTKLQWPSMTLRARTRLKSCASSQRRCVLADGSPDLASVSFRVEQQPVCLAFRCAMLFINRGDTAEAQTHLCHVAAGYVPNAADAGQPERGLCAPAAGRCGRPAGCWARADVGGRSTKDPGCRRARQGTAHGPHIL